jgi:hypothetical protein
MWRTPCARRLWSAPPSPKVRCPGGARCRRRFRAGRRRRGSKEAGRGNPENPAWTRPGFGRPRFPRFVGLSAQGSSPGRSPPPTRDRSRRAAEVAEAPPSMLTRLADTAMPASAGDAPDRLRERGEAQGALNPGARPRVAVLRRRHQHRRAGRPPRAPRRNEEGGNRSMSDDRAAPAPPPGSRHPDPPPAAAGPARSGAEHKLR